MLSNYIHPYIIKYVISDYMSYDDICNMKRFIKELYLSSDRVQKVTGNNTVYNYKEEQLIIDGIQRSYKKYIADTNVKINDYAYDCKGEYTGTQFSYNTNGKLIHLNSMRYNDFHGVQMSFHPDGSLSVLEFFEDGYNCRETTKWHQNGNIKQVINYQNYKKHGPENHYDENGLLHRTIMYKDGIKIN